MVDNEGENVEHSIIVQQEKIKLTKNSKGFNWEISLLGKAEDNMTRLVNINNDMTKNFGGTS